MSGTTDEGNSNNNPSSMEVEMEQEDFNEEEPTTTASASTSAAVAPDRTSTSSSSAGRKEQESIKRKAIQAIMTDRSLDSKTKSLRIQALMDGSSSSLSASNNSSSSGLSSNTTSLNSLGRRGSSGRAILGNTTTEEVVKCLHYERQCNIVAPCCGKVYGCRLCHDDLKTDCDVAIDRFAIREVVCKQCHTRQERSNKCVKCNIIFAEYHCNICNLWMDLSKKPFHCEKCGFCRVGGAENYRHCDECCMCLSITNYDTHSCLKDKYKNKCTVCFEDLFSSRSSPWDLPCGHAIHSHCFRSLAAFDHRCPICKKTVVSPEDMRETWDMRAADIAAQPMPEDLRKKVSISCNDCQKKNHDLDWHFLGVRCPDCLSFNTVLAS